MLRALTVILTISATAHCLANPPAVQDAPATRTILAFPGAYNETTTAQPLICQFPKNVHVISAVV